MSVPALKYSCIMKKLAVITGVSGQDGAYLSDFLLKKRYNVLGIAPCLTRKSLINLNYFKITDKVSLIKGDITDCRVIKNILKKYKPDEFYNLAGQSSVAVSWQKPAETFLVNAYAVEQMIEILRANSPKTRFFQASSAEIYGDRTSRINEAEKIFMPSNPYAVSKLAAHLEIINQRRNRGLFLCNGILYTHISPLQTELSVAKKIVSGAVAISQGSKNKLRLGNIDIIRDWGFAGDVVRAMWKILQQPYPADYIICTERSYPVKKVVKLAFQEAGIKNWERYVAIDVNLIRKNDVNSMRGSCRRLKKIGWKPSMGIKETIALLVEFEKKKNEQK